MGKKKKLNVECKYSLSNFEKSGSLISEMDEGIREYLQFGPLIAPLSLTRNKNLQFHWSNWDQSCAYLKKIRESGTTQRFQEIDRQLEKLKSIPIWMTNGVNSIVTNLDGLYASYIDPRLRETWFAHGHGTMVSFDGISGPYVKLHSMRWFEKDIYDLYIYKKILEKTLPLRDFRLSCEIPVDLRLNGDSIRVAQATMYQFSQKGLTLKVFRKNVFEQICVSDDIVMSLLTKPYILGINKNLNDQFDNIGRVNFFARSEKEKDHFRIDKDAIKGHLNLENSLFSNGKEFYIFLNFKESIPLTGSYNLDDIFPQFVSNVEKEFSQQMDEIVLLGHRKIA